MQLITDGRSKPCLGFISRFDTSAVYLKGWICEANGSKPNASSLACTLNALVLDAPLASVDADRFMRERMVRGGSCAASPVSQTVDTRSRTPRQYQNNYTPPRRYNDYSSRR
jgi:hypothetical protein